MSELTANAVLLRGGPIITMNRTRDVLPAGTGILCIDGRIDRFILPESDGIPLGTRHIEMGSHPILPAFLDVHAHFGMTNDSLAQTVDCHTPPRDSIEDILDALRDGLHLAEAREGWLLGQGSLMQDKKLRDARLPTRYDLDRVSTTIPIVVRCGGHVTVLNSLALERSGLLNHDSLDGSAELVSDAEGPNGILVEGFVLVPIPSLDAEERRRGLRETLDSVFTRNGVTYLGEISNSLESLDDLAILTEGGPITIDAYAWMPDTARNVFEAAQLRDRFSRSNMKIRGAKIFVDGGFSAMTAATKVPYLDTKINYGELYYDLDELSTIIRGCYDEGLQLIAHANGERAQELVCEANKVALGHDRFTANTRLEHAGNLLPDIAIVDEWIDAGVSIVSQPGFLYTMGDYFPGLFGPYGSRGRFPYRTLLERGFPVAASSDVSGSELRHANPMFNAWCAVERIGFNGSVIDAEESIDQVAALEMQTVYAAHAAGVEAVRGSLEVGKVADIVALSSDPRSARSTDLLDISVVVVVKEAEVVLETRVLR